MAKTRLYDCKNVYKYTHRGNKCVGPNNLKYKIQKAFDGWPHFITVITGRINSKICVIDVYNDGIMSNFAKHKAGDLELAYLCDKMEIPKAEAMWVNHKYKDKNGNIIIPKPGVVEFNATYYRFNGKHLHALGIMQ